MEYLSLLPRQTSLLQVVHAIAKKSGWNSMVYIGGEEWGKPYNIYARALCILHCIAGGVSSEVSQFLSQS